MLATIRNRPGLIATVEPFDSQEGRLHLVRVEYTDSDGVAVVPRARAQEVLDLAEQLDFREHSMYPYIEKFKSIQEAVKKFGRL